MKTIACLMLLSLLGLSAFSQSFTLPGDGKWYRVASNASGHAYIEYYYKHLTAHNPSIAKGEISFINARNFIIQKHQTMGYVAWNQPQFAIINFGNQTELWVKATSGVNSGTFEILQSRHATLTLGDISDANLSDNGGTLKIYDKLSDNSHTISGDLIVADGNIGVGIANPTEKLTVDGKIRSEEVKVEIVNGADHVFQDDYKLQELDKLEAFIQENKHLPEIPSEKEMQENGLEVGEFQIKLLQKIEELTLYIIDQNKLLREVMQKNEKLESSINAVEK